MSDTTNTDLNTWIRRAAGRHPAEPESTDTTEEQPPTDDVAKKQPETEDMNTWIRRAAGR